MAEPTRVEEDRNRTEPGPGTFARIEAVAALRTLQHRLPADVNAITARRLLAVAENPALSDFDRAEIASQR
jgi:hypothetical protein